MQQCIGTAMCKCNDCSQKMTPHTIRYLQNFALKNRWVSVQTWQKDYLWKIVFHWVIIQACNINIAWSQPLQMVFKEKSIAHKRFIFAKEHLKKPVKYWQHVLWPDKITEELFASDGACFVWYSQDHISSGCGTWECTSAKGEMTFKWQISTILNEKMTPSFTKLIKRAIFQCDSDPHWIATIIQYYRIKE